MLDQSTAQDDAQRPEEQLRRQVQKEIEAVRAQVDLALALLKAHPNTELLSDQIGALEEQLAQLDGLSHQARTGNIAQLSALQAAVPVVATTSQALIAQVSSSSAIESVLSIMELTSDQMAAREQAHWQQTQHFQQFEAEMFGRIDELARAKGLDVSAFHETQEALQAEYEVARAKGDLATMLRLDALRATNVRMGLEQVGATEAEIQAAREQERATERGYLDQIAIEARREAEGHGLSPDDTAADVAAAVGRADAELDDEREALIAETASLILDVPQSDAGFSQIYEVMEAKEVAAPMPTPERREDEHLLQR